ncbi:cell division protein FtsZ [Pantoea ananatis BRT175]|nr:cell division protein FtsZ [Pantoea ananatis BRT175]
MYGTALLPRRDVLPGTLIRHNGKSWLASANVEKGLYAISGIEKIRITSESVEIVLNNRGQPQVN